MSAAAHPNRTCRDCGRPADFAVLDEQGTMHGWLCDRCDRKHRMRKIGLWHRVRRRVKAVFGG